MPTAHDPSADQARTSAFLEGQGVAVALDEIEDELDRLWGPAAEQAGGPELDQPSVTRVVLANLIVLARGTEGDRVWETLEAIAAQYPSRTILLRPGGEPGKITAEVSALCHLPAPGRPQVCSERIVLYCGEGSDALIPGAIRPLLVRDLHTVLWCCDDPLASLGLIDELGEESTRLILDRPDPDGPAIAQAMGQIVDPLPRDLAWFGITPWREIIAQLFDPPTASLLGTIDRVRVLVEVDGGQGASRTGLWLISWLAGQLGWRMAPRHSGAAIFEFEGPTGLITTAVETRPGEPGSPSRLAEVAIELRPIPGDEPSGCKPGRFLLRKQPDGSAIRVEVHSASRCELPRLVSAPPDLVDRRVAAALQSYLSDPPYERASPIFRELIGE
jgi:hypothetical protein